MKYFYTILALIICFLSAQAQDKHFSQFYSAPMTTNPALTGAFDGSFRIGAIYRNQWRGALENPFQTYAASFDMRFKMGEKRYFDDAIAGGVLFFADRVGNVDFNTTQMAFSFAYHKALDRESTQYLSAGFKMGFAQRNLNYERLYFEDQFNGVNNYNNPTGEILPENNISYGDFAAGLYYTISPEKNISYYAGMGVHHFNSPNISFYKREEEVNRTNFKLPIKYLAHFGAKFPITEDIQFFPKVSTSLQGGHLQINAGGNVRVKTQKPGMAMHLGLWGRPVRNNSDWGVDAIIALAGLEYQNVLVGVSYDANINSLANYSKIHGAFELSFVYLGSYENESILCPTF